MLKSGCQYIVYLKDTSEKMTIECCSENNDRVDITSEGFGKTNKYKLFSMANTLENNIEIEGKSPIDAMRKYFVGKNVERVMEKIQKHNPNRGLEFKTKSYKRMTYFYYVN